MGSRRKVVPFKDLEKKWYAKLAKSGFEDAEDTSREDRPLRAWHSLRFEKDEARETYYDMARQILNTYKFLSKTDRRIWELHSEGWSRRSIAQAIRINHNKVYEVIRRIIKETGLKSCA